MNKIELVKTLVAGTEGKFFTVSFIKKDGSERSITGRIDVSKYTKGGVAGWKANGDNIGIYEIGEGQYRAFNAGRVTSLKIAGKIHTFNN